MLEVGERIVWASKTFGAVREPIFRNFNLSLRTRGVYIKLLHVLGVLLIKVSIKNISKKKSS